MSGRFPTWTETSVPQRVLGAEIGVAQDGVHPLDELVAVAEHTLGGHPGHERVGLDHGAALHQHGDVVGQRLHDGR